MNITEPRSQTRARFAVIMVSSAVLSLTLICPSADVRHAPALASAQDDIRNRLGVDVVCILERMTEQCLLSACALNLKRMVKFLKGKLLQTLYLLIYSSERLRAVFLFEIKGGLSTGP